MPQTHALPEAAAAHGFALFEDKVIFEAQAPITSEQLAEVERRVGRPVPPGLRALWQTAFGGRVGYDLQVQFDDHVATFSFAELFYPESDGYRDLWGWIDHERELAEENADEGYDGRLRFLPFGGFEYLDRLYVCLDEPHYGAVFAWMQGLPSAWALRLHEDSVARIADDVPGLFRLLALDSDPFDDSGDYNAADETVDAISQIDGPEPALADALRAAVRRAVLDWRGALDAGTLASSTRLRHLAFRQVAMDGDLALAERIAAQGCDLNERYAGGGNLVDHLLASGHDAQAGALIERGIDASQAIVSAAARLSPERTRHLLSLGAEVTPLAAAQAAVVGSVESAELMVDALPPSQLAELVSSMDDSIARAESSASRVEAGTLGSNMTPAQYRQQAEHARALQRYVAARMASNAI
ncbi:SMI1/KNR4 family protein [Chitinasiproducens palmae]|uniref:Knr4/Smi1-like domain-containing protein n=1 Tax=Chitinasiproducens palmae TaxID=1770053 RepID=A0A1H2PL07_9BURK|nr:SMI1/KNR4 family protein [Chitinasiproducens palmae]SDV47151.1 hypothetical protein SAMN05216551_102317 [Chitinasiproducens palmae]